MKAWQFLGLLSAINIAPHKTNAANVILGVVLGVACFAAAVLDK
jgi:hypothetical protein